MWKLNYWNIRWGSVELNPTCDAQLVMLETFSTDMIKTLHVSIPSHMQINFPRITTWDIKHFNVIITGVYTSAILSKSDTFPSLEQRIQTVIILYLSAHLFCHLTNHTFRLAFKCVFRPGDKLACFTSFHGPEENHIAQIGQVLRINCTVRHCNDSQPKIVWYKGVNATPVAVQSPHITTQWEALNLSIGRFSLEFQNITITDSGLYRCNEEYAWSFSINVTVHGEWDSCTRTLCLWYAG